MQYQKTNKVKCAGIVYHIKNDGLYITGEIKDGRTVIFTYILDSSFFITHHPIDVAIGLANKIEREKSAPYGIGLREIYDLIYWMYAISENNR